MSVQSEISRISIAKSNIATAITNKGVTVPTGTKLDGLATLIDSLETGSGSGGGSLELPLSRSIICSTEGLAQQYIEEFHIYKIGSEVNDYSISGCTFVNMYIHELPSNPTAFSRVFNNCEFHLNIYVPWSQSEFDIAAALEENGNVIYGSVVYNHTFS